MIIFPTLIHNITQYYWSLNIADHFNCLAFNIANCFIIVFQN